MFYQIFLSPQVKRCAIITCKNGIHELPYELSNNWGLKSYKIRKNQVSLETSKNIRLVPSAPAKMQILLILAKNFWKAEIKHSRIALFCMKTRVSLKHFENDCRFQLTIPVNT